MAAINAPPIMYPEESLINEYVYIGPKIYSNIIIIDRLIIDQLIDNKKRKLMLEISFVSLYYTKCYTRHFFYIDKS